MMVLTGAVNDKVCLLQLLPGSLGYAAIMHPMSPSALLVTRCMLDSHIRKHCSFSRDKIHEEGPGAHCSPEERIRSVSATRECLLWSQNPSFSASSNPFMPAHSTPWPEL